MESIILMNSKWGNDIFVPMYLFFGGLSGGLFVIAVAADLLGIKFKQFEKFSRLTSYLVLPVLALAGAFIAFHLGKPERGILFPFFFKNYNSWLVIGGWSVGLAVPLVAAYAALWYYKTDATIRRVLGVIAFPILGFVSFYTGLLLSGAMFVPLWSQEYLPYLFLNSGVLTGLAGSGLMFVLYQTYGSSKSEDSSGVVRIIGYAIIFFVLVELFELQRFMDHLASNPVKIDNSGYFVAPNGSAMAYEYVTQGVLAPWFWWGIIGIGLTLPLFLSFVEMLFEKLIKPYADWVSGVKFASILSGGIILRFVIVWGGELKAPLTVLPQLNQIPLGG
ncbi:MAG: NrfD/PsrC family molybdoenzyme membrane anchor subunit [Candidatus Lambdaproteobacteria bacterium]|jgi:formate-dependent nitrite reductase membrane component NrfD|nr:polysulfide reductase NrfD [Candidatus Lambdaproteobacteria bacterium]